MAEVDRLHAIVGVMRVPGNVDSDAQFLADLNSIWLKVINATW
jgi:hypothetical protein